jgi:hypothetical protein
MGTKKQKNVPGKIDGQLPIVVKKLRMIWSVPIPLNVFGGSEDVLPKIVLHLR